MPNSKGVLSRDDREHLSRVLGDKNVTSECRACGTVGRFTTARVTRLTTMFGFGAPEALPVIPLICDHCGHVQLFDTTTLDLPPGAVEWKNDEGQ